MDPRIAARAMVAVVLVAVVVSLASSIMTPTYEASAQVWVDQKQGDQQGGEIQPLPPPGQLQTIILEVIHAIDSRPVAEEATQRLGLQMGAVELLDNLTVEQIEDTRFIVLTYEGTDPERAQRIVNTVAQVATERMSEVGRVTADVLEKAAVPAAPVSPHPLRNGLLTLVVGWALIGLVVHIHRTS